MKKILSAVLVLCLLATLCVGAMAEGKEVINLWTFTDEVPNMMAKFLELNPDFDAKYEIVPTIIPTTDGLYQPALDQALANGEVDLFCAEGAFVLKYTQGDACDYAATYADMGIDVAAALEAANIAQYTVDIGTRPSDGELVGLGYQATGGAFIYRRSIAQDVFGTDDPAVIKDEIGPGFDKFFEAAAKLGEKGYAVVSGDGDLWHAVENSSETGWLLEDGETLNIDPAREAFLDMAKELYDNNWYNNTRDWTDAWFADMKDASERKVFGFFGPAWLINYTIGANCGKDDATGEMGTWGDWAVCEAPVGFFWGGTWILGAADSTKLDAVGQIINWITLDASETGLQYFWANGTLNGEGGTKDTVASGTVMSISDGALEFLGGQNMFDVFVPANAAANGKTLTQYDESINSIWRDQVRLYAAGEKSREDAIADFKATVADTLGLIAD